MTAHTLVASFGSDFGDDQAGPEVLARLAVLLADGPLRPAEAEPEREQPAVRLLRLASPADLLDRLTGGPYTALHLVDACSSDRPVGAVVRMHWPCASRLTPSAAAYSGHHWNVGETLQTAQQLGLLPSAVVVWSLEIDSGFTHPELFRAPLSPPVAEATRRLADDLARALQAAHCRAEAAHA